jgi:hypothetical protein
MVGLLALALTFVHAGTAAAQRKARRPSPATSTTAKKSAKPAPKPAAKRSTSRPALPALKKVPDLTVSWAQMECVYNVRLSNGKFMRQTYKKCSTKHQIDLRVAVKNIGSADAVISSNKLWEVVSTQAPFSTYVSAPNRQLYIPPVPKMKAGSTHMLPPPPTRPIPKVSNYTIKPGQEHIETVVLVPQGGLGAGTHTIKVKVDPNNKVGEKHETNNERSASLLVKAPDLPDLSVIDVSLSDQGRKGLTPASAGNPMIIRLRYENLTKKTSSKRVWGECTLTKKGSTGGVSHRAKASKSVEAYQQGEIQIHVPLSFSEGDYNVECKIDSKREVSEVTENNNTVVKKNVRLRNRNKQRFDITVTAIRGLKKSDVNAGTKLLLEYRHMGRDPFISDDLGDYGLAMRTECTYGNLKWDFSMTEIPDNLLAAYRSNGPRYDWSFPFWKPADLFVEDG